jgi:hypothetical protein
MGEVDVLIDRVGTGMEEPRFGRSDLPHFGITEE